MIIGMFGILKTGSAYVPLNTDYPAKRLNYIVNDSAISYVVYTNQFLMDSLGLEDRCIDVNESVFSSTKPTGVKTSIDLCAYIMYTSGTTAHPKGIAVSHRNVIKTCL